MAIKFSQFNLRTDHTSGMFLVGYDGNQNIHITVDNLFDDFISGTPYTIPMFDDTGVALTDSILSQNASATEATVTGVLNVTDTGKFETNIEVEGTADLFGNVNLGDEPDDFITQAGTLSMLGPIKDTTDTLGDTDQILVSDANGELTFTDLADIAVGSAEVVEVPVKNLQGSALTKGDPVYISGSVGASGRLEVQLADASNAAKMPAVGLLKQDLGINEEGFAVVTGKLRNLPTSPIDGQTPLANDVIYVKASGTTGAALTLTKPTGSNLIQNMGKVGRVSTSNDGTFVVSSILRTNDIPNLTPGKIWVGSTGNTIESSSITFTESTGAVQLNSYGGGTFAGTATQTLAVDINGNIIETPGVTVEGSGTAGTITKWHDTDTITDSIMSESGSNITIAGGNPDLILNNTGNSVPVWGIGATYQGSYGTGGKLTWINSITAGYAGVRLETGNSKIELPRTTSHDFNLVIDSSTAVNIDGVNKNVIIGGTTNYSGRKLLVYGRTGIDGSTSGGQLYLNKTNTQGSNTIFSTYNNGTAPPQGYLQWGNSANIRLQAASTAAPYTSSYISYGNNENFIVNLAGTPRLTIDYSNGNATLTGALEVGGKVTNVTDPTDAQDAATKAYVDAQNTNQITGTGTANYLPVWTGANTVGNSAIYQDSDGHVGVGVTGSPPDPVHKFEVYDDRSENLPSDYSQVVSTVVGAPFTGGAGGILSRLSTDGGSTFPYGISLIPGSTASDLATSGRLAFYVNSDLDTSSPSNLAGTVTHDDTDAHWILNGTLTESTTHTLKVNGTSHFTSSVGIGTPNPVAVLQVTRSSGSIPLFQVDDVGDKYFQVLPDSNTTFLLGDLDALGTESYIKGTKNDGIQFHSEDGELVRIKSNGHVGIGTDNPIRKLSVEGGGFSMFADGGTSTDAFTVVTHQYTFSDENEDAVYSYDGTNGHEFSTGGSPRVNIKQNGNVGIGATNPARKLTVEAATNPVLIGTPTGKRMQWENPNYITAYSESPTAAGVYNKTFDFDGDYLGGGYVGVYNSIDGNWGVAMHAAHRLNASGHKTNILHVVQVDDHSSNIRVESRDFGSDAQRFSGIEINDSRTPTGYPANRFRLGTSFSTEPTIPFYVNGNGAFNGSVKVADDSDSASSSNVGALRYRTSGNNSYVDMVMQTGASTYEWVNIVQNNW